jgi:hypothetical protein
MRPHEVMIPTMDNHGLSGLLPNRNDLRAGALSLRERVAEGRVREIRCEEFPHPSASLRSALCPLPEGEGTASRSFLSGNSPFRAWLDSAPLRGSDRMRFARNCFVCLSHLWVSNHHRDCIPLWPLQCRQWPDPNPFRTQSHLYRRQNS